MSNFENNILIMIIYIILIIVCIYLVIEYIKMNIKLNKINNYVNTRNKLGQIYVENKYDPILFETLLLDALSVLRDNINIITTPYFYSKSIEDIFNIIPSYIYVMKFIKYMNDHPDTQNDAIHIVLQKNYGDKYKTSDKLLIKVNISISKFNSLNHKHSILTDLTRAKYIYKKNISKINNLIN